VSYISLSDNNLIGPVPNLNLPNLKELWLNNNQLSGTIPNFSHLPNLTGLGLHINQLSGTIPNFSGLPNLQNLNLNDNQLSGEIPNFSNLPNLTYLRLWSNRLSGTIPNFSSLPKLTSLYLDTNQLSGTIPDFSHLPNLTDLELYNNQLSGTIPNLNWSSFTTLKLNNNCGLVAYDAAQATVLSSKDADWQVRNPACAVNVTPTPTAVPPTSTPAVSPTSTPTATPTATWGGKIYLPLIIKSIPPTPTPTPTLTPTPANYSFFDDFSDPNSGWLINDDGNAKYSYQNGEYEIGLYHQNWWGAVAINDFYATKYSVEADMYRYTGSNVDYGLIFDRLNWDNFYLFEVTPDYQKYCLYRYDNKNWIELVPWTYSAQINQTNAINHLKVDRDGGNITVYVNGQQLANIYDDTFSNTQARRVGMYAETYSDSVVPGVARFDNFYLQTSGGTKAMGSKVSAEQQADPFISGGPNSPKQ